MCGFGCGCSLKWHGCGCGCGSQIWFDADAVVAAVTDLALLRMWVRVWLKIKAKLLMRYSILNRMCGMGITYNNTNIYIVVQAKIGARSCQKVR